MLCVNLKMANLSLNDGLKHVLSFLPINRLVHHYLSKKGLTVVLFHEVDCKPSIIAKEYHLCIHPHTFERQIQWLISRYTIISPKALFSLDTSQQSANKPHLLLTFDDCTLSVFVHAYPILKRFGLEALCFINFGPVVGSFYYPAIATYLLGDPQFLSIYTSLYPHPRSIFDINYDFLCSYLESAEINESTLTELGGQFPTNQQLVECSDVYSYSNHLFNHPPAPNLSNTQLLMQFTMNESHLRHLPSTLPCFSYPFGQPQLAYTEATNSFFLRICKGLSSPLLS